MTDLPRSKRVALLVVAAFVATELGYAIWAAFVAHGPLGPRVGYGPDSAVYILSARSPVWSHRFLAGPGPFGFLLLAKLSARNLRAIVVVQTVVASGASRDSSSIRLKALVVGMTANKAPSGMQNVSKEGTRPLDSVPLLA